MNGLLPMLGAGLAVIALVIACRQLGFRGVPLLDGPEEALAIAQALPGGFHPVRIAISGTGCAALLADGRGRVALVGSHGAHFVAREINQAAFASRHDDVIAVHVAGPPLRLALGAEAADWFSLLRQAGART